jgi:predicted dehydrogenase
MRSLQSGKHVVVFGRLAATADEAVELTEEARRRRLLIIPAYHDRYNAATRSGRTALSSGRVGLPWNLQADYLVPTDQDLSRTELLDLGVPAIDAVLFMLGRPVTRVYARVAHLEGSNSDDVAVVMIDHDRGVTSTVVWGRVAGTGGDGLRQPAVHRFRASGSHGVLLTDATTPRVVVESGGRRSAVWAGPGAVEQMVEAVSHAIASGISPITPHEIVESARVLHAAEESIRRGGPIELSESGVG